MSIESVPSARGVWARPRLVRLAAAGASEGGGYNVYVTEDGHGIGGGLQSGEYPQVPAAPS